MLMARLPEKKIMRRGTLMRDSLFETIVGFAVVVVAVGFLMFSLGATEKGGRGDTYELNAEFRGGVTGVTTGSDVRLRGVKIGVVSDISMDKARLVPVVTLAIEQGVELDEDTIARISADGLLGGSFISLDPGGGYEMLVAGDTISNTQSALGLDSLLTTFASNIDSRLAEIATRIEELDLVTAE